MGIDYSVERGDVADVISDLLVLKYAQDFYGADKAVASILADRGVCSRADLRPEPGKFVVVETHGIIAPKRVMFVGGPSLGRFRYNEMRKLARLAVEWVAKSPLPIRTMTATVHGAGYGLDVEESLQAMLFGFQIALAEHAPAELSRIIFVEQNRRRAGALETSLRSVGSMNEPASRPSVKSPPAVPQAPPEKKTAFVAMPFSQGFEDVYEFGIYGPIRRCGYVCERVDESAFAGDIVGRIQEAIRDARFVIADLTDERPNVYLEVGYAWGLGKPVILIAREGQKLHFDLSHHKCLFYPTIGRLAAELDRLVRELFGVGSVPERRSWDPGS